MTVKDLIRIDKIEHNNVGEGFSYHYKTYDIYFNNVDSIQVGNVDIYVWEFGKWKWVHIKFEDIK